MLSGFLSLQFRLPFPFQFGFTNNASYIFHLCSSRVGIFARSSPAPRCSYISELILSSGLREFYQLGIDALLSACDSDYQTRVPPEANVHYHC